MIVFCVSSSARSISISFMGHSFQVVRGWYFASYLIGMVCFFGLAA